MNSVIFLYAAIAIDVGLCVKWHFDDKREAAREQQAELHRKQAAEERLKKTQTRLDELDKEIKKTKAERERVERQYAPKVKTSIVTSFRHHYDVVGESFDNEDGTSRQEILDAISNCEPPYEDCEVSLDKFDYKGERALAVKVNGDQIGCIARKDLDAVFNDLEFTDAITLKVFGGDNGKNYGAAITLIANADE